MHKQFLVLASVIRLVISEEEMKKKNRWIWRGREEGRWRSLIGLHHPQQHLHLPLTSSCCCCIPENWLSGDSIWKVIEQFLSELWFQGHWVKRTSSTDRSIWRYTVLWGNYLVNHCVWQTVYVVSKITDLPVQSCDAVDSWLVAMIMKIVLLQIVLIDNCADKRGLERAAAPTQLIDHCAKIAQKVRL